MDYMEMVKVEESTRRAEFVRHERGNLHPEVGATVYAVSPPASNYGRVGDLKFLTVSQDYVVTSKELAQCIAGDGDTIWEMRRIR